MPSYHRLGQIPRKRHTVFRRPDGSLLHEELMGNQGFSGASSLFYHLHPPTAVRRIEPWPREAWTRGKDERLRPRHFRTARTAPGGDPVEGRRPLLYNQDVALSLVRPDQAAPYLYRNGMADELLYIARGGGVLESVCGRLPYGKGDHLIIPRSLVHRLLPDSGEQYYLVIESRGVIRTPKRYRSAEGQCLEGAPYSERDFRLPQELVTIDQEGEFEVRIKQGDRFSRVFYRYHPFDLAGWDGCYYPWAFNIGDFEPIVGRIHQPPPVHQAFEGDGFVICDFVPRLFDFDPQAVPIPYHHTNAQSDEVIFYASEEFMSRRGIEFGSISLHPDGLAHGPHPGTIEASLGRKETKELAVMLDTFRPLLASREAEEIEDQEYFRSWLDGGRE
jgi:homogentisate 1,2-dioxygenase